MFGCYTGLFVESLNSSLLNWAGTTTTAKENIFALLQECLLNYYIYLYPIPMWIDRSSLVGALFNFNQLFMRRWPL